MFVFIFLQRIRLCNLLQHLNIFFAGYFLVLTCVSTKFPFYFGQPAEVPLGEFAQPPADPPEHIASYSIRSAWSRESPVGHRWRSADLWYIPKSKSVSEYPNSAALANYQQIRVFVEGAGLAGPESFAFDLISFARMSRCHFVLGSGIGDWGTENGELGTGN